MIPLNKQLSWLALRPDAQAFDEVRIITVPRYKESGLSGDEWRISATIQLWRKGVLIHERGCGNIEAAVMLLGDTYLSAIDNGLAYFAGDGILCDQEGCNNPVAVRYQKIADYNNDGTKKEPLRATYRHFCERHSRRGDCGLDDADSNYVIHHD